MKKTGILFSLILYSSVSLICADHVDTLNELFEYPSWRKTINLGNNELNLIDRWIGIEDHFCLNDLISRKKKTNLEYPSLHATPIMGNNNLHVIDQRIDFEPIVTKDNAEYKTRKAHHFLSCKYVLELRKCYVIVAELAAQCQKKTELSESETCSDKMSRIMKVKDKMTVGMHGALSYFFDISPQSIFNKDPCNVTDMLESNECLNSLMKTITKNEQMTLRMHGALSFFYKLSPHILFNKDVSHILEDFLAYTKGIIYVGSTFIPSQERVEMELRSIEKNISDILRRFWEFYTNFCYPVPSEDGEYGSSFTRKRLENTLTQYNTKNEVASHALSWVKDITVKFIESFDNDSGFCFVPISNTTLPIKKDKERLKRINYILKYPGWAEIKLLRIKEHRHNQISAGELLNPSPKDRTSIVSNENVYNKSQIAHRFLSCKYTLVLKECFDYAIFMWKQCEQNTDDIGSGVSVDNRLAQFKTTAEKSDPLVSRLRNALSFFYRLTPEMEYNKEVFNIIESFRTAFVLGNVTPNVENVMSEFLRRLYVFFKEFCWPEGLFDLTPIPEHTVDNDDLQVFIKKINSFIETDYDKFGFLFA